MRHGSARLGDAPLSMSPARSRLRKGLVPRRRGHVVGRHPEHDCSSHDEASCLTCWRLSSVSGAVAGDTRAVELFLAGGRAAPVRDAPSTTAANSYGRLTST